MPSLAPFAGPQPIVALPALYLYPLNDSFVPKHISLIPSGQRIKIGRQTNAKSQPGERNGYFDSKVLSRQHAEVWEENEKIYIKDVKSSNGTFINGERLSQEGAESEPFELHSDDIVEFGIDIVGEDNKTIIHHKVAARVACILTDQQAAIAGRAEQQQHQQQQNQGYSQSPILGQNGPGSGFNFAPGTQQGRRPPMQPQQHQPLGGMGGSMRPPGKGISFDVILSRLQGELNKSRETGQDLQTLTSAMNDIQDTLGGSLPLNLPPYPHALPPVRPPSAYSAVAPAPSDDSASLADLQSQLLTTQSSLTSHVDKIRALEGVFADQEALKEEVRNLRELVGVLKQTPVDDEETELLDDDDDTRSVATVIPHTLERVEEEDEDDLEEYDNKQAMNHDDDRIEHGRPRTPEPTNMGMPRRSSLKSPENPTPSVDELTARLSQLSSQLESALAMSSTLQAQHVAAQNTIVSLEDKVKRLEGLVTSIVSAENKNSSESITTALSTFKSSLQGQWTVIQEEWAAERERLKRTRDEWEREMRGAVDERVAAKLAHNPFPPPSSGVYFNGGLVTPPSPRSLSADSGSSGSVGSGRRRRRRSPSRGRTNSLRRNSTGSSNQDLTDPPDSPLSDDAITELALNGKQRETAAPMKRAGLVLETEEVRVFSPLLDSPGQRSMTIGTGGKKPSRNVDTMHIQTAIGVLVLSVAAAAVIWRVKPE
ncbi:Glycosyltransferase family 69 protein [Mycena indigotica]|uniref:Glycosyltransferase family 69 protein n=1 Tax=Mycena indigotica TaxID=2126181 RepID=A0A8H6VSP3_9AGAR|nr:Glycosyltransferase family 69 protein [Mycena indigotica]KAF7290536.1 Glycosyltransferase family 69 protein [Mycena indigotica]